MEVREITAEEITRVVTLLCIEANYSLGKGVEEAIRSAREQESGPAADALTQLLENGEIAKEGVYPFCQDTGMAVIFVEVGQDLHITGSLTDAINEGVRRGYKTGYLRNSVVKDPLRRVNSGDNTPAVIHFDITPGNRIRITVAPKGFGSENKGRVAMLKPSDGLEGLKRFVVETVRIAGPDPCPPIIVGVGVGGTMDKACLLSKQALLRTVGEPNQDSFWAQIEREIESEINALGIGPAGLGGNTTALAVHIETYPTHIAGLPVAAGIGCCATRHKSAII